MAGTGRKANDSSRPAWAKAIRDLRLRLKFNHRVRESEIAKIAPQSPSRHTVPTLTVLYARLREIQHALY
jgi:hypothetical protein